MSTTSKIQSTDAPPAANDHMEQRAAEIADRESRSKVSDEHRKKAYEEMKSTAPRVDKASH